VDSFGRRRGYEAIADPEGTDVPDAATSSAEEKIRFTIAEYCHRTDLGDFDGWVALFTEDGCFRMPGHEVTGRAALRAFIARDQPPEMRGLHLVTDSAITMTAPDRAEVRSNFLFVAAGGTAGVVVTGGRYLDVLVPVGNAWLFSERETELVLPVATQRWGA
jgi:3-phenylpropionate/cinnamic acid dioxygenase small subunit